MSGIPAGKATLSVWSNELVRAMPYIPDYEVEILEGDVTELVIDVALDDD